MVQQASAELVKLDGAPPLPPRTAIIFTPLPAAPKPQGKKKFPEYIL